MSTESKMMRESLFTLRVTNTVLNENSLKELADNLAATNIMNLELLEIQFKKEALEYFAALLPSLNLKSLKIWGANLDGTALAKVLPSTRLRSFSMYGFNSIPSCMAIAHSAIQSGISNLELKIPVKVAAEIFNRLDKSSIECLHVAFTDTVIDVNSKDAIFLALKKGNNKLRALSFQGSFGIYYPFVKNLLSALEGNKTLKALNLLQTRAFTVGSEESAIAFRYLAECFQYPDITSKVRERMKSVSKALSSTGIEEFRINDDECVDLPERICVDLRNFRVIEAELQKNRNKARESSLKAVFDQVDPIVYQYNRMPKCLTQVIVAYASEPEAMAFPPVVTNGIKFGWT